MCPSLRMDGPRPIRHHLSVRGGTLLLGLHTWLIQPKLRLPFRIKSSSSWMPKEGTSQRNRRQSAMEQF